MADSNFAAVFAQAPLDAAGWERALSYLASATGARAGQLIAFEPRGDLHFSYLAGMDQVSLDDQLASGVTDQEQSWRVASTGGVLQLTSEQDYRRIRPQLNSEAYDEFCDRLDIPHGAQTILLREERLTVGLATLRTRKDGPSSAEQLARFREAMPLAQAAILMQQALDSQGSMLALGMLESMSTAVLLLDACGDVLAQTEQASAALRVGPLRLGRRRLSAASPVADRRLQAAIAEARTGKSATPARIWLPGVTGDRTGFFCQVFPLPRREWGLDFRPSAMVVIDVALPIDPNRAEDLRAAFNLTAAEAEIALHIANGITREHVARLRGSTVGTVAIQLKSILQKAGVRREAELVALINKLLRRTG